MPQAQIAGLTLKPNSDDSRICPAHEGTFLTLLIYLEAIVSSGLAFDASPAFSH